MSIVVASITMQIYINIIPYRSIKENKNICHRMAELSDLGGFRSSCAVYICINKEITQVLDLTGDDGSYTIRIVYALSR